MPETVLPVTTPLRLLLAVAVITLKALVNVPVEPLLSAADRAALASASPVVAVENSLACGPLPLCPEVAVAV